jgi:hypothetical protein
MNNQNIVGYFRNENGTTMSIGTAVTMGFISRGAELGTIVLKGITYKAPLAVEVGFIDEAAAAFLAARPGSDQPAPAIREDHQAPLEDEVKTPAATALEALGAFFTSPTTHTKAAALAALESHLKASGGTA